MNHEEKIKQIEAETAEIKQQIMKLEFQHKKDIVESEKRFNERSEKIQAKLDEIAERQNRTQNHLDHITKLVGVSFEELDQMDERLFRLQSLLDKDWKETNLPKFQCRFRSKILFFSQYNFLNIIFSI